MLVINSWIINSYQHDIHFQIFFLSDKSNCSLPLCKGSKVRQSVWHFFMTFLGFNKVISVFFIYLFFCLPLRWHSGKKSDHWSPSTPKRIPIFAPPPCLPQLLLTRCAFYVLRTSTALCIFAGPQAGSCPECSGWASSTTGLLLHITQTEASQPTHSIIGVPHIFQSLKSHWRFSILFHFIGLALLPPPNCHPWFIIAWVFPSRPGCYTHCVSPP